MTALRGRLVLVTSLAALTPLIAAARPVETYGMMFVCDGAKGDVFWDYAVSGKNGRILLPNVRKWFIDGGVWVKKATTVFPTITGAAMPAVLTGCLPGRHNLPSLYFFSRKEKKYPVLYVPLEAFQWDRWLSPDVKTIWEHFEGPNDAISMGPALHRGSDDHIPILWNVMYKPMEVRAEIKVRWRALKRKVMGGLPAGLIVVYNGWFDHMEHGKGARSDEMIDDYLAVDRQVGEAMEAFMDLVEERRREGADVRYFAVLTSDHGHQDVREVNSIDSFIKERQGARVVDKLWTTIFGQKVKGDIPTDLTPYEMVCAAGEGHALLYFPRMVADPSSRSRYTRDWERRPTLESLRRYPFHDQEVDVVKTAVEQPAVSFLTGADEAGIVHVYGRGGEATIERRVSGGRPVYAYRVVAGADPLRFAEHPAARDLVGGSFHSARQWQMATLDTDYPDAVLMLHQVFDARERAADLFLSAAPYVSIGDLVDGAKSKSKHGGLTVDEAWSTVAFHGTGLSRAVVRTARTIDAVPTLLALMEHDHDPTRIDGEPIPEVMALAAQARQASIPAAEIEATRQAIEAHIVELGRAPARDLAAWAASLKVLLARPGLSATTVPTWRARAYSAVARRREPEARRLLEGELPTEFLYRPRPDLAGTTLSSGGNRPLLAPPVTAGIVRDAAQAAYRRVFALLQIHFARGTDPASAAGQKALGEVESNLAALSALRAAGLPVAAPRLTRRFGRSGTNLTLEGLADGPDPDAGTMKTLADFVRIERARGGGDLRRAMFDRERALIQAAIGERLQRFTERLTRPAPAQDLAPDLAGRVGPGQLRTRIEGLAALAATHSVTTGAGARAGAGPTRDAGSQVLDGLYQEMGAPGTR